MKKQYTPNKLTIIYMIQNHKPIYQLSFIWFRTMNTDITIIYIFQDKSPPFKNCTLNTNLITENFNKINLFFRKYSTTLTLNR